MHSDGSLRVLYQQAVIEKNASGVPIRIFGTMLDITEQNRSTEALEASEEKYRLISENAIELVILSKFDGTKTYVSPSARKILGYEPEEVLQMQNRSALRYHFASILKKLRSPDYQLHHC